MEIIIIDKRKNTTTPPCDGAYKKSFVAHNVVKCANEFTKRYVQEDHWYETGREHGEDGLTLSRYVDCEEWFIKVDSAEELFEFIELCNGEKYFTKYPYDFKIPTIYIRDWI